MSDYTYFSRQSKNQFIDYAIDSTGTEMDLNEVMKKVKKYIDSDDKAELEVFVKSCSSIKFSNYVFVYCCEKLSRSCFDFFYSFITPKELKNEEQFTKKAADMAKQGKNYDGRDLWTNSHKRNARTPPPAKYSSPRESIIPEECFYVLIKTGKTNDVMDKAKDFVKYLMIINVPIGDNVFYSVNEDSSIQGYVSMLYRYLYQGCLTGLYASEKKKNFRQSLKDS